MPITFKQAEILGHSIGVTKIMLGEVANAGTPTKTAFPKGRAENETQ